MALTTLEFAKFVACILIIYNILPSGCRWITIFLANLYFCFCLGNDCLFFILICSVFTYVAGLALSRIRKNWFLFLIITVYIILLLVVRLPLRGIFATIGISFYSLICIGYCIDVYRGMYECERNPFKLVTFVTYFPHVIQGPFDNYGDMKGELFKREYSFDYDRAVYGMYRIAFGVMKKIVLSNRISNIIDAVYNKPGQYYGLTIFFVAIMYSIQLYADFSGYMDIATGVSNLLGISIKENFNVPYLSKSMAEFWRRWHMSLGEWFKNYVFYPVQRTKLCNAIRKRMKIKHNKYAMNVIPVVISLLVVWTLIGIWHGFDWNYLLYDWFCGAIIILSEIIAPFYKLCNEKIRFSNSRLMDGFRILRTYLLVVLSFLIFRPDTISDSICLIRNMFMKIDFYSFAEFVYWGMYDLFLIFPAIMIVMIADFCKYKDVDLYIKIHKIPVVLRYLIYIIGIVYIYVARYEYGVVSFSYSVF